jgi:Family of unknown function (DUF6266)
MAIAQNPLTGQMRKAMGNFVTSTNAGQNIVRAKAFNVKDANTDSQKAQRASFKLMVQTYQSLGGMADRGFPNRPQTQSPYNAFMAANLPFAIDVTGSEPVVDYPNLIVANGSLHSVNISSAILKTEGILIEFASNKGLPNILPTDVVVAFLKTKVGVLSAVEQARGADAVSTLLIPAAGILKDDLECVYLYTRTADRKKVSKSVFVDVVQEP